MEFAIRLFSKGSISATFSCSRAAVRPAIATYAGCREFTFLVGCKFISVGSDPKALPADAEHQGRQERERDRFLCLFGFLVWDGSRRPSKRSQSGQTRPGTN